MSETINRLKNIEIGCVYIGELDKRGDELKAEIQRLSNWITQLIACDWCMIKECFYTQEENIYSLFNILLDQTICKEFDAYYYDEKDKNILVKYASVLSKSLKYINIQNDFFHFYIKYVTKHLKILNFKYNLELPICQCQTKCITNISNYCNDCEVVNSARVEIDYFIEQYNVAPDKDDFITNGKIKANEKFDRLYKMKTTEENINFKIFDYKGWNMLYYSWCKISEFCQAKIKKESVQIDSNTIINSQEFNHLLFVDKECSDLFFYLVNNYATNKSVIQFSQIYRWMLDRNKIKNNRGKSYMEFVRDNFEIDSKFSRIDEKKDYETATLNEFHKTFKQKNA